jgi:phytanoyl-CoA hydroxylase
VEFESAVMTAQRFSTEELEQFHRDGFIVVPELASTDDVERMRRITEIGLRDHILPIEYEADLKYPGAPSSLDEIGGRTIRRLKQALGRDPLFLEWILRPEVLDRLKQVLGPGVVCPLAHHNCIMTKQPRFSSETGWHQDIRYWSYERPELVNAWIALGHEHPANGCLQVIPGSHRWSLDRGRFDAAVFFRTDLPENVSAIATRQFVELSPGDVLFFHCKTLHAASRNASQDAKFSAVFTFRSCDNPPLPNTRSSSLPELLLTPGRSPESGLSP